jgi:hypothetical protein
MGVAKETVVAAAVRATVALVTEAGPATAD